MSELTIRLPAPAELPAPVIATDELAAELPRVAIATDQPDMPLPTALRNWLQPPAATAAPRAPVVQLAPQIAPAWPAAAAGATPVRRYPGMLQSNQESIPPGSQSVFLRNTEVPPIGSLTINIKSNVPGAVPESVDRIPSMENQLGKHEFQRALLNYSYRWEAPAFVRNPLYFEQPNLERYGYDWGIAQPFISGAQFFAKVPLFPYYMTVHPPCECVYSLGYYRPGNCVPYQINWPEVRLDAAFMQGAFITGLVFLLP